MRASQQKICKYTHFEHDQRSAPHIWLLLEKIGGFLVLQMGTITKRRHTKDWQDTEQYPKPKHNSEPTMVSATPRKTPKSSKYLSLLSLSGS